MDSIRATLDAAYIQGFLGFFGALLGAIALIFSIKIAAKNTLNEIKSEKVAESKRDQYIALTDAYVQYLVSSLLISNRKSESDEDQDSEVSVSWNQHLAKYIELEGCINKVNLVTTSEIRVELFKIEEALKAYQTSISNYYFNNLSKNLSDELEVKVFEFSKLLRADLGIENDSAMESNLMELRNKS
ncbi:MULTISPECIES: hypothetical protein [Acinetobacter]|uniref:hypothetical protein n=1 Tax=Acinetobacter TaxID=469 RepID=UPI0002AE8185|nr:MULTISPECIES: hypothetical protein [Acinetobacter]ELW80563.1 hypothetical protein ACINWC743_A0299 [Acinetobacter sp. WC-743]MBJ8426745.1 hypothetical protein [Acinetobacter bereziniae]MBJ8476143.1 hypothetical protein [Acinetobacter bereziniae]